MDSQQFAQLQKRRELLGKYVIDIQNFTDKSDRTLSFTTKISRSSTRSVRVVHHFFIRDGLLHSHNYEAPKNLKPRTTRFWSGESVYAPLLAGIPGQILRSPIATDFEFAEMMENLELPLHFYDFDSPESRVEKIDGIFYGLINRTERKGESYSDGFRTIVEPL
jgi:hypothetical protein